MPRESAKMKNVYNTKGCIDNLIFLILQRPSFGHIKYKPSVLSPIAYVIPQSVVKRTVSRHDIKKIARHALVTGS